VLSQGNLKHFELSRIVYRKRAKNKMIFIATNVVCVIFFSYYHHIFECIDGQLITELFVFNYNINIKGLLLYRYTIYLVNI
jgi:hypothetical protein